MKLGLEFELDYRVWDRIIIRVTGYVKNSVRVSVGLISELGSRLNGRVN